MDSVAQHHRKSRHTRRAWLRRHESSVLLTILAILLMAWIFALIANFVQAGHTQSFDEWAVLQLRHPHDTSDPLGPRWLQQTAIDITALGGTTVLVIMTLGVAGYLILIRRYHIMWLVLASAIGGTILSYTLKDIFERERPQAAEHLVHATTASFPSGHAMMSATIYLTLGALMSRAVADPRAKWYFLLIAFILTLVIGVTRIYLGVHYPTDVLAGWCAGFAWALLCWHVARILQRRGAVEQPAHIEEPQTLIDGGA